MAGIQMNCISVEVEITIISGSRGMPYSIFHPNNPFICRNDFRPLPYLNYNNKFENCTSYGGEVHWVVEEELTITPPSLDLNKAFNCFNSIPSGGAKYSIKLCVDVPNNRNPETLSLLTNSETGHSFVVVTKSNGNHSVTQVFGFYAQKHPGYLFPFRSMPSVIKNNQLREINASIEMGLTEVQFELLRKKTFELAKRNYEAADYNCTNYGLELFNSLRTSPIIINTYTVYLPKTNPYSVTESNKLIIDKTPQMLFKQLKQMKYAKVPDAPRIVIDTTGNTKAPISHGECN